MLAELVQLAPGGVEAEHGPGYVEYAIYGAEGELPTLPDLEAATGDELIKVSSSHVPDDWADRWRDFHRPILVADRLWVRPSWEPPREGAIDVVIDPGNAFGTGAHPTTRLCLELLCELGARGEGRGSLVDLGTGSGVLAIAAAKLGWDPVIAVDHERAALEATRANAAANHVEVDARSGNLRSDPPPLAATLVANLTAPLLRDLASRFGEAGRGPVRVAVCSGLLAAEVDEVAAGWEACGLGEGGRRAEGDWVALLLRAA